MSIGPLFAHVQDQGARPYQEDKVGFQQPGVPSGLPELVVLADGMGGHVGGDTASKLCVSAVLSEFSANSGSIYDRLQASLEKANNELRDTIENSPDLDGMGTTLVALSITSSEILWLSVGDSPLWLVSADGITKLNADHSMADVLAGMVEDGRITAEEAATDSRRNSLLSSVMGEPIDMIDAPEEALTFTPGQTLILASDGLDTLNPGEILAIVLEQEKNAQTIAEALLKGVLAKERRGQDNVTIAVMICPDSEQMEALLSNEVERLDSDTLTKPKSDAVANVSEVSPSPKNVPKLKEQRAAKIEAKLLIGAAVLAAVLIVAILLLIFKQ